jgi:rubrerythrin
MEPSFSAVWSRVTGSVPPEDELAAIRRWSQEAAEAARFFSVLSRRTGDPAVRETLRSISREEEKQLRRLSSLYFLRTGDRLSPSSGLSIPRRPILEDLRERYLLAQERSEAYARASESAPEDTKELCLALSEEEKGHARQLKVLVERLL